MVKGRTKNGWMIGASIAVAWLLYKGIKMTTGDHITDKHINELHPELRPEVYTIINNLKRQGLNVRVYSGYRSFADQKKLYDQGRTTGGNIVTNAKPGQSYHNYGLALDVVPIVNGKAIWNKLSLFHQIAREFKSKGWQWGGDWSSFKDYPHFQKTFGKHHSYYAQLISSSNKYPNLS